MKIVNSPLQRRPVGTIAQSYSTSANSTLARLGAIFASSSWVITLGLISVVTSGCAMLSLVSGEGSGASSRNQAWMKGGVVALSRPVPAAGNRSTTSTNGEISKSDSLDTMLQDPVLGFMPNKHSKAQAMSGRWAKLNRASRTIELYDGEDEVLSVSGDGLQGLKPGTYSIVHRQSTPLWYAPDMYFAQRLLDVPTTGSTQRYRRGALGTAALFLDENTPIHSGPMWREEIGGVRLSEEDMSHVFSALQIGAKVVVE